MKTMLLAGIALLALNGVADEREARARFDAASAAYTAGDLREARLNYESILASGYSAPAVSYNLGNTCFKLGDYGHAVLHYRRAWSETPRDTELIANMNLAMQAGSAAAPDESIVDHLLTRASKDEWIGLAIGCYWLAAGLLMAGLASRARGPLFLRAAAACVAVALMGAFAACRWQTEWVVTASGVRALFAPLDSATPHFELPAGSIVRPLAQSPGWVKIKSGKDSGWIRTREAAPVSPWKSGADG